LPPVQMALPAGTKLGPYEILSPLGAGGMGEVYRAKDPRLGREVAIKVLPASYSADPDRLRRFEQEAKAAGVLSHPNITIVYDIGQHEGAPYVVQELLEGETLRAELAGGRLPPRKAIGYAVQISHGLAAAHEKGIVHRDLKPENLLVTKDGRVKILDFGLAKLTQPETVGASDTNLPTETRGTEPGVVLGTLGYMSPEQVKGWPADARSDIFALGSILYEMLSGKRAFQGDSAAETISAILREDPPDLSVAHQNISPGLERIVRHCLEKSPERRFQSASDIAFDLDAISATSGAATARSSLSMRAAWPRVPLAAAVAIASGCLAAGLFMGPTLRHAPPPSFRRLTFRRGNVSSARFGPGGQTVLYSASWGGAASEVFSASFDTPLSVSLGLKDALLAATRPGEAAVLIQVEGRPPTLAVAPIGGGAARPVLEDVISADWIPDGTRFAIERWIGGKERIEFPPGKVLYETAGSLLYPRISPAGDHIAFFELPIPSDNRGRLMEVDAAGHARALTGLWNDVSGLAWSPSGEEVWISAAKSGLTDALYSISRSGRERLLLRAPGRLVLQDTFRDGRALVVEGSWRVEMRGVAPGETRERDFSWLDVSDPGDVSADGTTLIFSEWGDGGGDRYSIFLRRMDGSLPVRLGDGWARGLSPDGKWVLAMTATLPADLVLVPTGPGSPRVLPRGSLAQIDTARWFPDGERVVIVGNEAGRPVRVFTQAVHDGPPRAALPEGIEGAVVSPDGRWIAAYPSSPGSVVALYPFDGGPPRSLAGIEVGDTPLRFSADGTFLFLSRESEHAAPIFRLSLTSGKRELWRQVGPDDMTGVSNVGKSACISADGSAYFYRFYRQISDLYLIEGLK
jgi:hypothetical protein